MTHGLHDNHTCQGKSHGTEDYLLLWTAAADFYVKANWAFSICSDDLELRLIKPPRDNRVA
jgi:hypothetical protein